jgi:cell division protein FtsN
LVLEYPGGVHSDEALLRLGLISAAAGDVPRAARFFRTLMTDYPRSPHRRRARDWLAENFVAIEEAELAAEAAAQAEAQARAEAAPPPDSSDAEAREPETVSPVPAETVAARFAVQVGAFESEERARSLLASVNASGFQARVVRVTGSPLVRVRIGTFLDRAEASDLMDRVRRRGHEATIAVDVAEEEPIP